MDSFPLPLSHSGPLRILLVEDSAADAGLLTSMLEDELPDAVISVTGTVTAAIPLLAEPVDIAIIDLSLPEAEGLQALTAILRIRPDLAVVVMTGGQDHPLALAALAAGAEDYIVKGSEDARHVATAVLHAVQRRVAAQEARRYERRALSLLDAMEAATCAVDHEGTIIAVNRAWRDFARENGGHPLATGVGANYLAQCQLAGGPDAAVATQAATGLRRVLAGELTRFECDYSCHSPAEERWMSVRMNPLPDSGAVVSHVDITAAKHAEQALSYLSLHDALTGLPNRSLLLDRLSQALVWAGRNDRNVGVAFVDVDQFKRINDGLGHLAGDDLLRALAQRLSGDLRDGDTLARLAGDEFVVLWPNIRTPTEADRLAHRLTESVHEPFLLGSTTVPITVSVGVVVGRPPQDAADLLVAADAAMYDAKRSGRGRTRMYTQELRNSVESRLRTEADLRQGLSRGEFVLAYQPVVDLRRHYVTGVEALVRWQHPDGLRMPDSFIPVAEATGLIVPLGGWVLEEACRQGAAWAVAGLDLDVAVNFSTRQIAHPNAISSIKSALSTSGLSPERLLIEVTESTVMEDAELAQVALTKIADLGVSLAIDDFGTGYSSLLYLKRYPIQALKVDRSFVAGMGHNAGDDAIVASVVSLARAVGAICIAEGVETREQHAGLLALGCDYAQGYLFGRPVSAAELPAVLESCRPLLADSARAAVLNQAGAASLTGTRWHGSTVARIVATPPPSEEPGSIRP